MLDQAVLDPESGKVVMASPPYPGIMKSLGGFDAGGLLGGTAVGGLVDQFLTVVWQVDRSTPKPLPGLITGVVRRARFAPGSSVPVYEPVEGALVSGVGLDGQPTYAQVTGATVAVSQRDGSFALFVRPQWDLPGRFHPSRAVDQTFRSGKKCRRASGPRC